MLHNVSVSSRYRTSDGTWTVEVVRLSLTPNKRDGTWLRVRHCGYFIADVRAVDDLAQYFELDDLSEDAPLASSLQRSVVDDLSAGHSLPVGRCTWDDRRVTPARRREDDCHATAARR
jgi:hypothetical protein